MTSFTFSLQQLLAAPPEVRRWAEQEIGAALAELARHAQPRPRSMILPYHAAGEFPLRQAAMQQPLLPGAAAAMSPFEAARGAETGHSAGEAAAGETTAQMHPADGHRDQQQNLGDQQADSAPTPAIAACTADEAVRLFGLLEDDLPTAQVFFEFGRETATRLPDQPLCVYAIGDIMRHARLSDGRQLLGCLKRINAAFQHLRNAADLSLFGIDGNGYLYLHETTHQSIHRLWADLLALEAEKHPHPIEMGRA